MSKTWRKVRRSNADDTFRKPLLAVKRAKQALQREINEERGVNGTPRSSRP